MNYNGEQLNWVNIICCPCYTLQRWAHKIEALSLPLSLASGKMVQYLQTKQKGFVVITSPKVKFLAPKTIRGLAIRLPKASIDETT